MDNYLQKYAQQRPVHRINIARNNFPGNLPARLSTGPSGSFSAYAGPHQSLNLPSSAAFGAIGSERKAANFASSSEQSRPSRDKILPSNVMNQFGILKKDRPNIIQKEQECFPNPVQSQQPPNYQNFNTDVLMGLGCQNQPVLADNAILKGVLEAIESNDSIQSMLIQLQNLSGSSGITTADVMEKLSLLLNSTATHSTTHKQHFENLGQNLGVFQSTNETNTASVPLENYTSNTSSDKNLSNLLDALSQQTSNLHNKQSADVNFMAIPQEGNYQESLQDMQTMRDVVMERNKEELENRKTDKEKEENANDLDHESFERRKQKKFYDMEANYKRQQAANLYEKLIERKTQLDYQLVTAESRQSEFDQQWTTLHERLNELKMQHSLMCLKSQWNPEMGSLGGFLAGIQENVQLQKGLELQLVNCAENKKQLDSHVETLKLKLSWVSADAEALFKLVEKSDNDMVKANEMSSVGATNCQSSKDNVSRDVDRIKKSVERGNVERSPTPRSAKKSRQTRSRESQRRSRDRRSGSHSNSSGSPSKRSSHRKSGSGRSRSRDYEIRSRDHGEKYHKRSKPQRNYETRVFESRRYARRTPDDDKARERSRERKAINRIYGQGFEKTKKSCATTTTSANSGTNKNDKKSYSREQSVEICEVVASTEPSKNPIETISAPAEPVKESVEISEPKEKETSPDPKDCDFYDADSHWCKTCNVICNTLNEFFDHLHSPKHKVVSIARPWADDDVSKNEAVPPTSSKKSVPLKGSEFIHGITGFYCDLCCEHFGDAICAENHIKSSKHNQNYQIYVQKNPTHEKFQELGKAACRITVDKGEKLGATGSTPVAKGSPKIDKEVSSDSSDKMEQPKLSPSLESEPSPAVYLPESNQSAESEIVSTESDKNLTSLEAQTSTAVVLDTMEPSELNPDADKSADVEECQSSAELNIAIPLFNQNETVDENSGENLIEKRIPDQNSLYQNVTPSTELTEQAEKIESQLTVIQPTSLDEVMIDTASKELENNEPSNDQNLSSAAEDTIGLAEKILTDASSASPSTTAEIDKNSAVAEIQIFDLPANPEASTKPTNQKTSPDNVSQKLPLVGSRTFESSSRRLSGPPFLSPQNRFGAPFGLRPIFQPGFVRFGARNFYPRPRFF